MSVVERIFAPRLHDIGGLTVGRVLPFAQRCMVGPFIFLDHMGPAEMAAGQALDVRPHPHIGLSTLTYLFEGEIFHRDNLGNALAIAPGAVNWMTAGRGIAHSERTRAELRATPRRLHGLQCWVALPGDREEVAPEFRHYPADAIPETGGDGAQLRVIAGAAYGLASPVKAYSPLFYVHARLAAGATLTLPEDYADKAAYVIEGEVATGGARAGTRDMVVFGRGRTARLAAETAATLLLLGGEPFGEERFIWWNFVSSSQERIAQAKADWKEGRFAPIPGGDQDFIPLPD